MDKPDEVHPRDTGLLGDDDDEMTWSPPPLNNIKFDLDPHQHGHHQQQQHASDASKTFKTISSQNNDSSNNGQPMAGGFSLGKIKVERPKPVQKLIISPNRPNANNPVKAELKGIDRPRSHSPLKLTGIEEYVQQYEKTGASAAIIDQAQKITMNLKMDDLLANVGKNESSYQMLDDFSVLTGDPDPLTGYSSGARGGAKGAAGARKRSVDAEKQREDNFGWRENNGTPAAGDDDDDEMNGGDEDEGDDDDDDAKAKEEKGHLNYKFTAVYRKDESTGAFKEQSKTIFESKIGGAETTSVAPAAMSKAPGSVGFAPVKPSRPAAPPPASVAAAASAAPVSADSARFELANALEALRNNSKKLDAKLEKFDTSLNAIVPPETMLASSDVSPVEVKPAVMSGFEQQQVVPSDNSSSEAADAKKDPAPSAIRKLNDTFFNDILSKSDQLISQTQNKLEKLSKLESVNKPIMVATKSSAPPPPKPKPTPSPLPSSTTTSTTGASSSPLTLPNEQQQQSSSLSISTNASIINSKSLIDFKASDETAAAATATAAAQAKAPAANNQVDLLFDLNEPGFTISSEPIKQGASYFDLLGLSGSSESQPTPAPPPPTEQKSSLLEDLLLLEQATSTNTTEVGGTYDATDAPSHTSTSTFKDPLLESIVEEPTIKEPPKPSSRSATPQNINSLAAAAPSIDILITEPLNERDDNNIVPEGYFNLKHEIPKDQSRPHSPSAAMIDSSAKQPNDVAADTSSMQPTIAPARPTTPTKTLSSVQQRLANMPSAAIARPRPVSPVSRPRPPSPTASSASGPMARSRPSSPRPPNEKTILEDEFITFDEESKPATDAANAACPSPPVIAATPRPIKKERKQPRTKIYDSSGASSLAESSSSEDDDDDEQQKISIMIRPKAAKADASAEGKARGFVPLLPRPPKNAQEVEELRQRRRSSDTASITQSVKADDESSSDDEDAKFEKSKAALEASRKKSEVDGEEKKPDEDEFLLELPDEDDLAPLSDFNDKCELKRYSDDTYGVVVLVRQPFRNPSILYKNALQKFTEVRTWTEYLVRLVTVSDNEKKLCFYNAHELLTMATEQETTIDDIVEKYIIDHPTVPQPATTTENNEENEANEAQNAAAAAPPPPEEEEKKKKISAFHEITLKATYKFTEMSLQQFDTYTKIHTFKIQELVYKETFQMRPDRIMALPERFFKKFTKPKVTSLLDHTPLPFEICKFAHSSYSYLRAFLLLLQDAFWSLPTITRKLQREQQLKDIQTQSPSAVSTISSAAASIFSLGANKQIQNPTLTSVTSSHTREEITVKALDEYKCKLDKQCRILSHRSRTRVSVITFLNDPNPIIDIGLNDCLRHGKEIVGRHDIIPIKTEQWISPEAFVLNENVLDKEEFERTHALRCVQMPDNLWVELIRFRTRPKRNYELPLHVTCFMQVIGRRVEIRIEASVGGTYFTKLSEVYCQDIQIRFPLPDSWVYMFRVEKRFRYGAVHSSKHKLGKIKGLDRFLVHKSAHQGAMMEASCGMAKYEQAFRALVWRIEQLPVKNKDVYKTQLFVCKLQLQEYDAMPEKYDPTACVQYSIPICASSKTQVRSVSVNVCEEPPEKWVKLKTKFEYELDINYVMDESTELPAVDQERCAELQHLSQTESEGDNPETNDDDD